MLNFMIILFYCKIIHICKNLSSVLLLVIISSKPKQSNQKNMVSEQTEQKNKSNDNVMSS